MKTVPVFAVAIALLMLSPGGWPWHSAAQFAAAQGPGRLFVFDWENVLGTSLELKVSAPTEAQSEKAETAALAEVDRENEILSSWDSGSEFSRWFRTQNRPVRVSPELFEVLGLFDRWRERTGGALDASAETITRVWQAAAAQHRLPTQAELSRAEAGVRRVHWVLDPAARTATHTSDAPLAMNSFVKSYIIERAAEAALAVGGIRGVVLNIGGDLVVRGDWTEPVDIADPKSDAENGAPIAHLLIRDRAVATSGDYRRGVEIAGRHYSHIVDPRTGMPAEEIMSSTVVAPDATDAGALATAFSVLKPAESARLAASIPGVEYLLETRDGQILASKGWRSLEAPAAPALSVRPATPQFETVAAQTAPAGAAWNPEYELTVGVELARIEGERVTRPYLAVWIEDEEHHPIRTLALWYSKLRYLNELRVWSNDTGLLNSTEGVNRINSISSATRPPGRYTFRWNGKDDGGRTVKAGKYTVLIECAREHGTYQLIRQEMDFDGRTHQIELPPNTEISAAYLDYDKVNH